MSTPVEGNGIAQISNSRPTIKTCTQRLHDFKTTGQKLLQRYGGAVQVEGGGQGQLVPTGRHGSPPTPSPTAAAPTTAHPTAVWTSLVPMTDCARQHRQVGRGRALSSAVGGATTQRTIWSQRGTADFSMTSQRESTESIVRSANTSCQSTDVTDATHRACVCVYTLLCCCYHQLQTCLNCCFGLGVFEAY